MNDSFLQSAKIQERNEIFRFLEKLPQKSQTRYTDLALATHRYRSIENKKLT